MVDPTIAGWIRLGVISIGMGIGIVPSERVVGKGRMGLRHGWRFEYSLLMLMGWITNG